MKTRVLLLASAIGLSVSVAAMAEPPIGSRLGDRMTKNGRENEALSAQHGHEFASCLVNRRGLKAEALLRQKTEQGYEAAEKKLFEGQLDCFNMWDDALHITEGRSFSMPPEVLRGFLAEEMIKRDQARFGVLPALQRQLTYSRDWFGGTNRHVAVDEMATCVSETAPAQTMALIRAAPYSEAESNAFGELGPSLGACLQAGTKVDANRQTLRAALADALYQRVANPPPPAPVASPSAASQAAPH